MPKTLTAAVLVTKRKHKTPEYLFTCLLTAAETLYALHASGRACADKLTPGSFILEGGGRFSSAMTFIEKACDADRKSDQLQFAGNVISFVEEYMFKKMKSGSFAFLGYLAPWREQLSEFGRASGLPDFIDGLTEFISSSSMKSVAFVTPPPSRVASPVSSTSLLAELGIALRAPSDLDFARDDVVPPQPIKESALSLAIRRSKSVSDLPSLLDKSEGDSVIQRSVTV